MEHLVRRRRGLASLDDGLPRRAEDAVLLEAVHLREGESSAARAERESGSELDKAHSRLYRSKFLQVNTHLKALAEIYTMQSFAQL